MYHQRWKAALVALTLALSAGVAACGDDEEEPAGGGAAAGGGEKDYNLVLIAGVKGDEFYITMNCGAQEKAKELGVSVEFQGPDQFDPSLQTPIVNAVAAKKPDAVLIAPTDTKAMYTPIKQLADAGSKIVLVDTTLEQPDLAVSQIASDNEAGGREAARALADLTGGSGKVFTVNVKPGISTTDARAAGFEEGAKEAGLDYLGQDFSNNEPAKAATIIKAQLAKNPDLKGVFATNLFSAEGTANGVREAGKGGDVKIVGFDAGPAQVEQLEKGDVQALIAQKPADIGAQGVEQAVKALNGEETDAGDRHRVGDDHEGEPRRQPGLALQVQLLDSAGWSRCCSASIWEPPPARPPWSATAAARWRTGARASHGSACRRAPRSHPSGSSRRRSPPPARRLPRRRTDRSARSASRASPRPACCSTHAASRSRPRSRGTTRAASRRPSGWPPSSAPGASPSAPGSRRGRCARW